MLFIVLEWMNSFNTYLRCWASGVFRLTTSTQELLTGLECVYYVVCSHNSYISPYI